MRVAFIVNMRAGHFRGRHIWQQLKQQLTIPYTIHETNYAGHAKELVQQFAQTPEQQLVIVVGGDGTMHEVVNGAAGHSHIVLGYVKGGSGNDFARAFTYFEDAAAIERFVKQVQTMLVDSGRITFNEGQAKYFINNFGIGFDAFVCQLANESKTKKLFNKIGLGKLSYAYFVTRALLQFKPFTLTMEQKGEVRTFQNVWFATVSNQPYFGGGMNLSPASKIDDAMLEITIVNNLPRLKFLALFLTVFKAKHTRFKEVTQLQVTNVTLQTEQLVPIHADGEQTMLTASTVYCEIVPQSIIIAK